MVFQKSSDSLILQVKCTSAAMHSFMVGRLHEHSEYNTEWSDRVEYWMSRGNFKNVIINTYKGTEHIIYEIEFVFPVYSDEFMSDLNSYFEPSRHKSEYIYHVQFGTIKTFLDE